LALEALTGAKISVGAPFYNLTFVPVVVPIFFAMPIGQMLAWKRGDLLGAAQRLVLAAALGCVVGLVLMALRGGPVFAAVGCGIAVYLVIGSFVDICGRTFGRGVTLATALRRATGLPRSAWGTAFAHAGLGVTLFGLAATGWGVERIIAVHPGDVVDVGPYQLAFETITPREGPNYSEDVAHVVIRSNGALVTTIDPSRRFFTANQTPTTEAGIATLNFGQVYASFADKNPDGSFNARLYWKPFVAFIWLGALVMAFGGGLSLSDRRLRIGIARRAVVRSLAPQPAE
jgi:cytochrome c-type biogenesis protein CcmF